MSDVGFECSGFFCFVRKVFYLFKEEVYFSYFFFFTERWVCGFWEYFLIYFSFPFLFGLFLFEIIINKKKYNHFFDYLKEVF